MTTTELLRDRMRTAALFGAALAALTPTVGCKADPDPADAGASGGSGGSGGTGGTAGTGGAPVGGDPGYPLAQDPGPCPPEPDAGAGNPPLSGPCCPTIECYDPPGGGSEHGKNLEGARSQGYNFAVLEQRSNPQIDLKTAQLDHATTGVRRSNGIRHLLTRI
jgi:hypothetical protein